MNTKRIISCFVAVLSLSILSACGGVSEEEVSRVVANAVTSAKAEATKAEAVKAESKLFAAKAEIKELAVRTARQGGFSASANCNVLPTGFTLTTAYSVFPKYSPIEYKEACSKEVVAMNSERSSNKQVAVNKAVSAERKRAADEKKRLATKKQVTKVIFEKKI